jgi:hypothetical protein
VNDYTLFDDFEYSGNWWLPGRQEDAAGGTVSFQQGRIMLEVHKPLSVGSGSTLAGEEFRPPVIVGDSRGSKITLYKTRERFRNPGGSTFFSAEFLLTGRHFDSAEVVLSSLFVRYTHLEEWIDKDPFDVDLRGGPSGQGSITYSPPEPVEFESPEKRFRLRLTHSSKRNFGGFRAIKWEHYAWIKIAAQHNEALDWYSDIVFSLSRVLSLLVGKPVIPIELNGLTPSEGELTEDGSAQREVDVFFDGFARPSTEQQDTSPFFRILVPLPDLEANLGQVLEAWFACEGVLRPVHNLYLATLGSTKMYVEFEFLALTQALEAFHRRMLPPGKYLTDEEWARHRDVLVAAIPEAISADHKRSLENRLKYGHEYSQSKRLKELITLVGAGVEPLIAENSNEFIERIVAARNDLTHYEGDPRSWAADVVALGEATRRLRRLLAALFWQELGVDNTVIQDGVSKIPVDPLLPY